MGFFLFSPGCCCGKGPCNIGQDYFNRPVCTGTAISDGGSLTYGFDGQANMWSISGDFALMYSGVGTYSKLDILTTAPDPMNCALVVKHREHPQEGDWYRLSVARKDDNNYFFADYLYGPSGYYTETPSGVVSGAAVQIIIGQVVDGTETQLAMSKLLFGFKAPMSIGMTNIYGRSFNSNTNALPCGTDNTEHCWASGAYILFAGFFGVSSQEESYYNSPFGPAYPYGWPYLDVTPSELGGIMEPVSTEQYGFFSNPDAGVSPDFSFYGLPGNNGVFYTPVSYPITSDAALNMGGGGASIEVVNIASRALISGVMFSRTSTQTDLDEGISAYTFVGPFNPFYRIVSGVLTSGTYSYGVAADLNNNPMCGAFYDDCKETTIFGNGSLFDFGDRNSGGGSAIARTDRLGYSVWGTDGTWYQDNDLVTYGPSFRTPSNNWIIDFKDTNHWPVLDGYAGLTITSGFLFNTIRMDLGYNTDGGKYVYAIMHIESGRYPFQAFSYQEDTFHYLYQGYEFPVTGYFTGYSGQISLYDSDDTLLQKSELLSYDSSFGQQAGILGGTYSPYVVDICYGNGRLSFMSSKTGGRYFWNANAGAGRQNGHAILSVELDRTEYSGFALRNLRARGTNPVSGLSMFSEKSCSSITSPWSERHGIGHADIAYPKDFVSFNPYYNAQTEWADVPDIAEAGTDCGICSPTCICTNLPDTMYITFSGFYLPTGINGRVYQYDLGGYPTAYTNSPPLDSGTAAHIVCPDNIGAPISDKINALNRTFALTRNRNASIDGLNFNIQSGPCIYTYVESGLLDSSITSYPHNHIYVPYNGIGCVSGTYNGSSVYHDCGMDNPQLKPYFILTAQMSKPFNNTYPFDRASNQGLINLRQYGIVKFYNGCNDGVHFQCGLIYEQTWDFNNNIIVDTGYNIGQDPYHSNFNDELRAPYTGNSCANAYFGSGILKYGNPYPKFSGVGLPENFYGRSWPVFQDYWTYPDYLYPWQRPYYSGMLWPQQLCIVYDSDTTATVPASGYTCDPVPTPIPTTSAPGTTPPPTTLFPTTTAAPTTTTTTTAGPTTTPCPEGCGGICVNGVVQPVAQCLAPDGVTPSGACVKGANNLNIFGATCAYEGDQICGKCLQDINKTECIGHPCPIQCVFIPAYGYVWEESGGQLPECQAVNGPVHDPGCRCYGENGETDLIPCPPALFGTEIQGRCRKAPSGGGNSLDPCVYTCIQGKWYLTIELGCSGSQTCPPADASNCEPNGITYIGACS